MSSVSKCQKFYKEQNDKECEDRISNLPSSLIGHILSLLPTKHAVATSVLSTRWKLFWTLITNLKFDDRLLLHREKSTSISVQRSFTDFVYRVLVLCRGSCLRVFHLKGSHSYDISHVNNWVAASLVCGVEELDLCIPIKKCADHVLTRDLFMCGTMVVLKLGTCFVMNVPTSVRMHSLKILHLHFVKLKDDDSIYRLICGCPVLDELSMESCVGEHVSVIHIFAPMLTKLFIKPVANDDGIEEDESVLATHEIVLDTPALVYLGFDDIVENVAGFSVENLSHLIKVDINFSGPFIEYDFSTVDNAIADLMIGILSVECLILRRGFINVLHDYYCHLPMLHNLTSLELELSLFDQWDSVLQLLKKSPRLGTLGFSIDQGDGGGPARWNPPVTLPTCLISHLKVIEVRGFEGDKEELKMLKYFLKNAQVLEKLVIHSEYSDIHVEKEVLKKLLWLPRASKICRIKMC